MTADLRAESRAAADELAAMVLDAADRLFGGEVTRERMAQADRGDWPQAIWQAAEQAGLPLALVPEALGGAGLPVAQGMQLVRRAGYHTLPVPLPETMLGALVWAQAAGVAVDGPVTLAPVRVQDALRLEPVSGGWRLHGEALRVPWASQVRHLLVFARDAAGQGCVVLLDAAGARHNDVSNDARDALQRTPTSDPRGTQQRNLANDPRDTLRWDGVDVPGAHVREAPALCSDGFLHLGALLRAQQMVGAMERCLDYAIAYAAERQQFGRPIGKFQAIQHMLADAAGQGAAAAASADLATDAFGQADFDFAVAVAKARVGEAAGKVAEICHQVHGAMGFTQEHPLHFATRRLWSWRDEFGHEAFWQQRIGESVCAAGGAALWQRLVD